MAQTGERGENTAGKLRHDFAAAAPWFCAALVLGIEAFEKSAAVAAVVALSSIALLSTILLGIALWNPRVKPAILTRAGPTSGGARGVEGVASSYTGVAVHRERRELPAGIAPEPFSS